ncbi:MAG: hypothetical protein AAF974_04790, partial [Cyanobacteria bacterium P01_E01_bin.34]
MADFTLEAEDLISVTGYRRENNALASGGSLLGLRGNGGREVGTATFTFSGDAGTYDIIIGTFDENDGVARFDLSSNGNLLGQVELDQNPGGSGISADTQVERTIASSISIADGDSFTITGFESQKEHARLDFIRFEQVGTTQPSLSLALDVDSISENSGTATATLTRTGDLTAPVTITLNSSDTTEATVPDTIVIPADRASIEFQVTGINDDDVDGTQTSTISATATGFTSASDDIDVTDDDVSIQPTLSLAIDADSLSENGGSTSATLTRTGDLSSAVSVTLNSSDTTEATAPDTIEIPANQASVEFQVTGVNDDDVDGTQTSTISATATGFTGASDDIDVTDDDVFVQPTLSLTIDADSISENGGSTSATLTRTGDLSSAVTVTLSSSDTTAATVPDTIDIPAEQASVQFQVTGVNDDDVDGTQTSTISA